MIENIRSSHPMQFVWLSGANTVLCWSSKTKFVGILDIPTLEFYPQDFNQFFGESATSDSEIFCVASAEHGYVVYACANSTGIIEFAHLNPSFLCTEITNSPLPSPIASVVAEYALENRSTFFQEQLRKYRQPAHHILLENAMINQLHSTDAHRIGYLCASEEADKEKEMLAELNKKSSGSGGNE